MAPQPPEVTQLLAFLTWSRLRRFSVSDDSVSVSSGQSTRTVFGTRPSRGEGGSDVKREGECSALMVCIKGRLLGRLGSVFGGEWDAEPHWTGKTHRGEGDQEFSGVSSPR